MANKDDADALRFAHWENRLVRIRVSYKEKQEALLELFTEEQYANDVPKDEEFMNQLETVQDILERPRLQRILKTEDLPYCSPGSDPPSAFRGGGARIKLPELKLKTYNGSYADWPAYRDMFMAMIGQTELSEVQKLQYLRSTLVGEPLDLVKALPITADNFQISWGVVQSRYDDKGNIASSILQLLFGLDKQKRSGKALRTVATVATEVTRGLEALGSYWYTIDSLIIFAVNQNLDNETKYQWEKKQQGTKEPSISKYIEFLVGQAKALENSGEASSNENGREYEKKFKREGREQRHQGARSSFTANTRCLACKEIHEHYECPTFNEMLPLDKRRFVRDSNLCFCCLKQGHTARMCNSGMKCEVCQRRHHTLLHNPQEGRMQNNHCIDKESTATLPILSVTAAAKDGVLLNMRVLLDTGSQLNLMTENAAQRLRLPRQHSTMRVCGIGDSKGIMARGWSWVDLIKDTVTLRTPFVILPTIGPGFDMLLGAEYVTRVLSGSAVNPSQGLRQLSTIFGPVEIGNTVASTMAMVATTGEDGTEQLDDILQKFWEVEDLHKAKPDMWTNEEKMREEHYMKTTVTTAQGNIQVRLPLIKDVETIGSTRGQAVSQLKSLESRLAKNKALKEQYTDFLDEYESLEHMKKVKEHETTKYHMPHHPVVRADSLTTKLRVVFNASALPLGEGTSLNRASAIGPTIQDGLLTIILRFRFHRIGLTADIEKMFRQIKVDPRDWPLQFTYGTASAPFIACRSIQYIADNEEDTFTRAAVVARRDFYVDDQTSGADNEQQARQLVNELNSMFHKYNINLRKWTYSHDSVLDKIDSKNTKKGLVQLIKAEAPPGKTLGVMWDATDDCLGLLFKSANLAASTKRGILAQLASVYDPLGLVTPITVRGIILMQDLWLERIDWDDQVTENTLRSWLELTHDLKSVNGSKVPRFISTLEDAEVHMFSDASERAYGAAIYIVNKKTSRAGLLVSKSKVAPIQTISIPRLELCAAHIGARLMQNVMKTMPQGTECYSWTDSEIVLAWLRQLPRKWKTFVANRTADIRNKVPKARWQHVPSEHNPADLISRGCTAAELRQSKLWWTGPAWISTPSSWPRNKNEWHTTQEAKIEPIKCMSVSKCSSVLNMLSIIRSHSRRIRAIAVLRRIGKNERETGQVTAQEYADAERRLWIMIQVETLDIASLKRLSPFIDTKGLWRVGGRLENATHMEWEDKHPIILPRRNRFVSEFILEMHYNNQHAGATVIQGVLQGYWILGRNDTIRRAISSCEACARFRRVTYEPRMGNLPTERVTPAMAFERTGVDFAGPFNLLLRRCRGKPITTKAYLCLFICMSTRAVHLEVAASLSISGFLSCFRRFTARRGYPQLMVSDNGTNFVGASRNLTEMHYKIMDDEDELIRALAPLKIKWKFITPAAPFMGGLWEAAVREAKRQIHRTIGMTSLTFEELSTLLADIEACLNTRPLFVMEEQVITPAHLVSGRNLRSAPLSLINNKECGAASVWKHLQKMLQDFWAAWKSIYLQDLQVRAKWQTDVGQELQVGDFVVVKDESTHPSDWPLFEIKELHRGDDGRARTATIINSNSKLQRPVRKLIRIPVDLDGSKAAGCCSSTPAEESMIRTQSQEMENAPVDREK